MATIEILCRYCNSENVKFAGYHYSELNGERKQRCQCLSCKRKFQLEYEYASYNEATRSKILAMLANASGIRDTARVLHVGTETVLKEVKKKRKM